MVYSVDIPKMPALFWRETERSVAEVRMYCMRKEQWKQNKRKIKILEWKQAGKQAYNVLIYGYNVVEAKQQ